ncbi:methylated-DNA--[protein]-cysteine S-methyltransferase [Protaetiibacter sp. SSC-01]|uniref:methylated-DNA--[protein]-cysteine S-methyltransferase n=1 Tax=Protaetiibacter sp. SSC-01 TaxID=2759943 RepID=UPI0016575719|nr:methylated-DNA--[protein]-cysteine S-methyltransferase [Protaetiibacter sp. SSC-01]QNO38532.1 methylated-DNA--[protein]-cysteine S-methyltransferase [Protaetiibacter sp. SSC-01]
MTTPDTASVAPASEPVYDPATTPVPVPAHPVALERLDSPIGRIEVVSDGAAIIALSIERDGLLPHDELAERPDDVTRLAVAQLREYFAGARREFDVPVTLHGTEFQLDVWERLVELQWGEVVSYGELGRSTGRPTAGRAVGGAVGANPVPIIVPCHRVLGSTGVITGYSGGEGIPTKSWLLDHENIPHRVPRLMRPEEAPTLDIPGAESAA